MVAYGPPREAVEAIQEFLGDPENHKYKPVQGMPALVAAIRKKLTGENGIDVPSARIYVTAGGNFAFNNALLAIADPGDEVILQTPYYFNHEMAITMANCKPVLVPTDLDYQLQPQLIEQAITSRTKAIVTISPNNPTGAVYPEGALRAVNQICRDRGIFHIHDEAYEYFTYDGVKHFSPGSIPGAGDYTISLFSLSKAYGFASWRIGYMVVPEHLTQAVNKIQDTILICAPVISQFAAIGALKAGRNYCDGKLKGIAQVRNLVIRSLEEISHFCEVPSPQGAFYCFLRVRGDVDSMHLVRELVTQHRVAIIPGTAFGIQRGCYVRLAYGALTEGTATAGLTRFIKGMKETISAN